jgi:iron-sulfur cluster repair protein YtfE (RIC family)
MITSMNRTRHPWMMVGLGAAGGILAGKLLPIMIANAGGMARGAAGQDPFAGLIREHRELLNLLDRMENDPQGNYIRRGMLFAQFKRKIAKHAMAEEDVVYPMLTDDAQRAEAARKLYEEHGRMKVLLFELEQSMKDDAAWRRAVRGLRSEIEPHARQEEEVEFPALRARMDQAGKMKLARKIDQEEAVIV